MMRAEMLRNMPELRQEIDSKVARLLEILRVHDPLRLLLSVALRNSVYDPEKYLAAEVDASPVRTEFALSLAASLSHDVGKPEPSEDTVEEFTNLIEEVLTAANGYFISETLDPKYTPAQSEARMQMLTETLNIRGETLPSYALDLVRALFTPHDHFLAERFGFVTDDFVRAASVIGDQILGAFGKYLTFNERLRGVIVESKTTMKYPSPEKAAEIADELSQLSHNPFEITPTPEVPPALLSLLSLAPGENAPFAEFKKAPGWPTNDSRIFERPLLTINGRFYAFAPHLPLQNLVFALEQLVQRTDPKYFTDSYSKKRGKVLETLAVKYVTALLPGAIAYEKVYYPSKECGDSGRCECDALVLFGRTLFIVEAKAAAVAASTRRGGLKSIEKDVEELIASAQRQGARVRRYIDESAPARFTYEDDSEAVTFESRAELGDIFIINVTLSHLGALATKLTTSAAMGLLKERVWPWTVSVNDLRAISEILDSPAEFIAFLKLRLSLHDKGIVTTPDENDLLGSFLTHGLDFTDASDAGAGMVLLDPSYTRPLDRFFLGKEGVLPVSPKPILEIPQEMKRLVAGLQGSGPLCIEAAVELLMLPRPVLQFIEDKLRGVIRSAERGDFHDLTIPPQRKRPGITIAVGAISSPTNWRKRMETYTILKKYRERAARWLLVTVGIAKDGHCVYDADLLEDEWRPDPKRERAAEMFFAEVARTSRS
jgi:hypothetical protein